MILWLLVTLCTMSCTLGEFYSIEQIDIPFPAGIVFAPYFLLDLNVSGVVGRLQPSIISVRPHWMNPKKVSSLFSPEYCKFIIDSAENYAKNHEGWQSSRHKDYPTMDLPLVDVIDSSNEFWDYFESRIKSQLFPEFHHHFHINDRKLVISDLFVVKYNSSDSRFNYLDLHQDKTPWSFVVALNQDFEGGGTYFPQLEELWKPSSVGDSVIFHSKMVHAGMDVVSGVRYILAAFCDYDSRKAAMSYVVQDRGSLTVTQEDLGDFEDFYDPKYEGYAYQSGFRHGDVIYSIEICTSPDNGRHYETALGVTFQEWQAMATSCELWDPQGTTRLQVIRKKE